jgi:hypothetical protein
MFIEGWRTIGYLVFTFLALLVCLSCSWGKRGEIAANTTPSNSAGQITDESLPQSTGSIREVDFANFTYDWFPQKLKSAKLYRQITLQNGSFSNEDTVPEDMRPVFMELGHVLYSDFNGDGLEDAVVYLSGSVPMNSFLGCLLLYKAKKDAPPELVWKHETGDRGNGGLRGVRLDKRSLLVDEYSPEVNPVQSLCCPTKYKRSYYHWQAGQFVLTKSEILDNEYSNAYFIGFEQD